jgi:hypothetical protein
MPEIWMPTQLDAIERKCPTPEVKSLVAEIRRLNVIAWRAHDVTLQFDQMATSRDALPETHRLMLLSLSEALDQQATGKRANMRQ